MRARAVRNRRPIRATLDATLRAADTGQAMSQENVDVVRRMLQAFNDGDIEALVAECDPRR
jgi:hypothetical protein